MCTEMISIPSTQFGFLPSEDFAMFKNREPLRFLTQLLQIRLENKGEQRISK